MTIAAPVAKRAILPRHTRWEPGVNDRKVISSCVLRIEF
jgi:hypothetical protein